MSMIRRVWDVLTLPAAKVPDDPIERNRIRVASAVYLGIMVWVIVQLIQFAPTLHGDFLISAVHDEVYFSTLITLFMLSALYGVCRTVHYRFALGSLAWFFYVGTFAVALSLRLSNPTEAFEGAYWNLFRSLYLGVLLATVFVPTRHALMVGAATVVTLIAWLLVFNEPAQYSVSAWGYRDTMSYAIAETTLVILMTSYWHYLQSLRRRQLQAAYEDAKAHQLQAEAANRLKSEFLAVTSHELKTPLNSIIGFTDLLLTGIGVNGPQLSEDQRSVLERVKRKSKDLLGNILDLLDMSKLEAKQIKAASEPFSPSATLYSHLKDMSVQAAEKGIGLRSIIAPDVPETLMGDPQLISRILNNLLSNAIKFTEQGHVEVDMRLPNADTWQLTVTDTGVGVPPDKLDTIFETFRQADSSSTRKFGGTGLGLAIARSHARLMGGDITVKSEIGVGSTFTVTLPLVLPQKVLLPSSARNASESSDIYAS